MTLDPFAGTRAQTGPGGASSADPFAGTRASAGGTSTSGASEERDYTPIIPDPKQWDWETAEFGMHGEKLPKGALSWTPYGQPYFGEGLQGKLKEYAWSFTKDVKPPDSDDWNSIKSEWQRINEQSRGLQGFNLSAEDQARKAELGVEQLGLTAQTIGTWWKGLEASKLSPLSYAAKGVSTSLKILGDTFSQASKAVKHTLSASQEFKEYANEVNAPIPRLDQNAFTKALENTQIGLVYDIARIALSPDNGNFENAMERIKSGWHAGRVFYSGVFDHTIREEYIRRYEAGENPDLLAMELSNREVDVFGHEVNANLVEMGGELIFDPLNFVGAFVKAGKLASEIDKASSFGGMLAKPGVEDAFRTIVNSTDEAKTYDAWKTVVKAHTDSVADVQSGKLLKQGWGVSDLTIASRGKALEAKSADFIGLVTGGMMREGFSKDEVLEAFKYGIKSISKDAEEMQMGLAGLAKLPNASYLTGDDAITTFTVIRKMLENEQGVLNFTRIDNLFKKTGNLTEFLDEAADFIKAEKVEKQFAKIDEMEDAVKAIREAEKTGAQVSKRTKELAKMYETVPAHAKLASRVNESYLGRARQWANNTLGTFYFNWQGGVAAKNILSNSVLVGVDQGFSAFAGIDEIVDAGKIISRPKVWSKGAIENNMKSWFGDVQISSAKGFDTLVSSQSGKKGQTIFGKWMESGERNAAMRVVDKTVRDTMKKMLRMDKMGDTASLRKAGLSDGDLSHLEKLLYANKGDTVKTLDDFRQFKGGDLRETWRSLDFLSEREIQALDSFDMLDELHRLTKTAKTTEDVESAFLKMREVIDDYARGAVDDIAGVSEGNIGAEIWGKLSDAENAGLLEPGASRVFGAIMESADSAVNHYVQSLRDTIVALQRHDNIPVKDRELLANALSTFEKTLTDSGKLTKRISNEMVEGAKLYGDEADKAKTLEEFQRVWKSAGLEGPPPPDLTRRTLKDEIWKQTKDRQNNIWNNHFTRSFDESETIIADIGKHMDNAALESQFSQARYMREQAQMYRHAVYENGALRIRPMDNIFYLAREFKIASQSASGAKLDQKILNIINKYGDDAVEGADASLKLGKKVDQAVVPLEKASEVARNELPEAVSQRFADEARRLMSELSGGGLEKGFGGERLGSSNVPWYRELYQQGLRKPAIDKALDKIVLDKGKDKGINVERVKEIILDNFRYGDEASGTPPDLYALQQLGADKNVMQEALDSFNDITRQNYTLEQALKASGAPDAATASKAATKTPGKYSKLEDVSPEEALKAFEKYNAAKGGKPVVLKGVAIPPPHPDGAMPSIARSWWENRAGLNHTLDNVKKNILEQWGRVSASGGLPPQADEALQSFMRTASPRVNEAKIVSAKIANEARNFTLLNYGAKTYGDVAASWVLPYHFWYTRQYKNWTSRLVRSPEVVAGYAKYKDAMEKIHYDMPDFFKQNVDVSKLANMFGIETSNPIFLNLEAAVNPLHGLTGTDFNDPRKRVDWFSNTLDDMGKFGPSIFAPLNIANAIRLSLKGEEDAAARFAGRIIPETKQLKELMTTLTGSATFTVGTKQLSWEADPAVWAFSQGIDPYERSRIGRALMGLVGKTMADGTVVTREMAIDAAAAQEGELWDMAHTSAVKIRSGPNAAYSLTSWILGAGFKGRTEEDVQIDEMYSAMSRLFAMNDGGGMTPDQFKQGWMELSRQYPYMDVVLLAKRGGDERDAAFAYNVLSRIPPGQSYDILKAAGLKEGDIEKFYNSKGFTDANVSFTESERQKFMAAVLDMSAVFALPEGATRQEWDVVKMQYSDLNKQIEKTFGADIQNVISHYYDLLDTNRDEANAFAEEHPEIQAALNAKQLMIMQNPLLYSYYGGIETIDKYYDGQIRSQLVQEFGKDITDKQSTYYDLLSSTERKAYLREHPELEAYWDRKRELYEGFNQSVVSVAAKLPSGAPSAILRSDFVPLTATQEELEQAAQPNAFTWQEFTQIASEPLQFVVMEYWQTGEELPYEAQKNLDYLASRYGFDDGDDLLRQAGLSLIQSGVP